jgi:hypothetical protein
VNREADGPGVRSVLAAALEEYPGVQARCANSELLALVLEVNLNGAGAYQETHRRFGHRESGAGPGEGLRLPPGRPWAARAE